MRPAAMEKLPAWIADYLAIPFVEGGRDRNGADCYGLVRLVLDEQFGLAIPADPAGAWTPGLDPAGREALATRIAAARAAWREVPRGNVAPGDVLLLRVEGRPLHVGVALDGVRPDGVGLFFHSELDVGPHCDDWNGARWTRRVLGFYRWGAGK